MRELPAGWEWARFDDVATVDSNLVDPADHLDHPHIAPNHIESRTGRLLPYSTVAADGVTSSKHLFRSGHILYSKIRPYLAKAVRVDFEGLCSADMYPVSARIDERYLLQWLLSAEFTALAAGEQGRSVLPKINRRGLAKMPVPVPPLHEQERIVAAIEEHLSRLGVTKSTLDQVHLRMTQFRRAEIDRAFADLEGSRMLQGHEVFSFVTSGSRGWAKYYASSGEPFIRVGDIARDGIRLDLSSVQMVRPPDGAEALRTRVRPRDLLITITADIGRVAVVPSDVASAHINQHVALARPTTEFNSEYLAWFVSSSHCQAQLRDLQRGATKAGLGLDDIRSVRIPVPEIQVQDELAARLSAVTDQIASFVSGLARQSRRAELLHRSILSAAVCGQLVPQDPCDEPATVLLDRIRAEREAETPPKRKRRSRS